MGRWTGGQVGRWAGHHEFMYSDTLVASNKQTVLVQHKLDASCHEWDLINDTVTAKIKIPSTIQEYVGNEVKSDTKQQAPEGISQAQTCEPFMGSELVIRYKSQGYLLEMYCMWRMRMRSYQFNFFMLLWPAYCHISI